MFQIIIFCHSLIRWIMLASLIFSIYRAYKGYVSRSMFSWKDNTSRSWAVTISHTQLLIGIILYSQSPVAKHFWASQGAVHKDISFFGVIHPLLMMAAIVLITIGSSLTKRKQDDTEKFKTILIWFSIALAIILIAVPWPFSPLANRPYLG